MAASLAERLQFRPAMPWLSRTWTRDGAVRLLILCALAIASASAARPAAAPPHKKPAAASQGQWSTTVEIHRLDESVPDGSGGLYHGDGYSWFIAWDSWITPADVPAEYRRRPFRNVSIVVVDVDTAGKPTGCRSPRASPEPRLDSLACDLLMKRSSFKIRYSGPAQPMPYRFFASIVWRTIPAAELGREGPPPSIVPSTDPRSPAPPPSGSIASYSAWPRLNWHGGLVPGPAPSIQSEWPGGAEGIIALDLDLSAAKGVTDCRVGVSSGDPALDEAACRVARTVPVRYPHPCEFCLDRTLPLQVVWKKAGSRIRLPLPPDSPAYVGERRQVAGTLASADFARLADRSVSDHLVSPLLSIDSDGRPTQCRSAAYSSGNRAVDSRLCELILRRMRYSRRTDVFGDPAPDLYRALIDLAGLL
jgi:TonB family protein